MSLAWCTYVNGHDFVKRILPTRFRGSELFLQGQQSCAVCTRFVKNGSSMCTVIIATQPVNPALSCCDTVHPCHKPSPVPPSLLLMPSSAQYLFLVQVAWLLDDIMPGLPSSQLHEQNLQHHGTCGMHISGGFRAEQTSYLP